MKNIVLGNKGMTLVEIMIVSLLSVFMMLTLTAVFSSFRGTWLMSQVKSDLFLDARKAMEEMTRELMEGSSGRTGTFTFLDTANGEYTQGVWAASSRGDAAVAGEDGSANNYYMHLDANGVVTWRSVVVFCPYQNSDGVKQVRRYVDYGGAVAFYAQPDVFPLTFVSATPTFLNFQLADGTALNIARSGGRVLANFIGNEDANNNNSLDANENDGRANLPVDNQDGVLNRGLNFVKSVGNIDIALFFSKELSGLNQGGRILTMTLRNAVKFRQP